MRIVLVLFIAALGLEGSAYAQQDSVALPKLRQELLERVGKDQAVRNALLERGMTRPDSALILEMRAIDLYEAGELDGQSYALLLDRVLVQDGKKQVYGTQIKPMHLWKDGPEPYPIQGRPDVDARRADVGLPPLDAHLKLIEEMYEGNGG